MAKEISFSNEELTNFSSKLTEFSDNLSQNEKDVLNLILARARGESEIELPKPINFTNNKESLINLANAIEGKSTKDGGPDWEYAIWTYRF